MPSSPERLLPNVEHATSPIETPKIDVETPLAEAQAAAAEQHGQYVAITEGTPQEKLQRVRERLGADGDVEKVMQERAVLLRGLQEAKQALEHTDDREPTLEEVAAQANFQGDWTELTRSRLEHPLGCVKFITNKLEALPSLQDGKPSMLQKPEQFKAYCISQMRDYDAVVERVFSSTRVVAAAEESKHPVHLGVGNYGKEPTVFRDAMMDGRELTPRQKNIIESHEAGHGVRQLVGSEAVAVRALVDMQKVPDGKTTYIAKPEEIVERMAQLKNYFGMGPTERFTAAHLEYARRHYVEDTQLDNTMNVLLEAIPADRTEEFVTVMNELPI